MVHLTGATLLLLAPIHVINAGSLTFLKSTKQHRQQEQHGEGYNHRGDCWAHRPVHHRFHKSFVQQTPHTLQEPQLALPGAGMHPEDIDPFQTVTKDGFLMSACVKDAMLEHGDKFGNNKHRYKMESTSNVSIVHYSDIIPREDREKMSINRCFDFCRTVPNMVYFGLHAGRDCYCTPYYKPMPGDSSNCDEVCEGEPSQMCGGKVQSSIFEMHSCADTRSELEDIITEVEDALFLHFQDLTTHLKNVADEGLYDAQEMQKVFGVAGGPDVSNYMQEAKVYSGELLKTAEEAEALIQAMQDPYDAASVSLNRNLRNFDNIKVAEDAIKQLKEGIAQAAKLTDTMNAYMEVAHPVSSMGTEGYNATGAASQYYPVMYFAEKDYQTQFILEGAAMFHHPTTCTGKLLQIVFGGVADDCAHACDGLPGKCDGFQFMDFNDGMCFLFESIVTVQQWTGCTQQAPAPFNAQCMGKLSRLEGVGGIAPREDKILEEAQKVRQGTGKCAHCLEKMEKSDRCYEYGAKCIGNQHDWQSAGMYSRGRASCERLASDTPGWCTWEWGRPGNSGQTVRAAQACPQCGYCISNGKSAGNPSIPWTNEQWAGDPVSYEYYNGMGR
jgi:hypothetical protein